MLLISHVNSNTVSHPSYLYALKPFWRDYVVVDTSRSAQWSSSGVTETQRGEMSLGGTKPGRDSWWSTTIWEPWQSMDCVNVLQVVDVLFLRRILSPSGWYAWTKQAIEASFFVCHHTEIFHSRPQGWNPDCAEVSMPFMLHWFPPAILTLNRC